VLQHLRSLRKSFSKFEREFDANALLLKILNFSTCKKSPSVPNTHSFKRVYFDDKLTWCDAASVRIKLKVSATQHHHRERAARAHWLAILKVRFLYGLPLYITRLRSNKINREVGRAKDLSAPR
jgi:hypothetical protein